MKLVARFEEMLGGISICARPAMATIETESNGLKTRMFATAYKAYKAYKAFIAKVDRLQRIAFYLRLC
jgi:hypothetical protein